MPKGCGPCTRMTRCFRVAVENIQPGVAQLSSLLLSWWPIHCSPVDAVGQHAVAGVAQHRFRILLVCQCHAALCFSFAGRISESWWPPRQSVDICAGHVRTSSRWAEKWHVSSLTCSSHLYVPPHFPHLRLSTLYYLIH